eukprot:TRINITY_DN160887_c0_g1_i1.p1 TRINITY_DN160887_c0_g1~~TRINITY_DN160887_c0_g1_i1.p1  ORF type:complete len:151 (+),score=12.02 TRINITY_DN160887_c0_g1_i1:311-763(+)
MNKTIKKIIYSTLMLLITGVYLSCHDDDVVFINEGDNLPIRVAFEFKFDESSGTSTSESVTGNTFEIVGKGINRMSGVENNALFFDGLSNEITGNLPTNQLSNEQFVVSLWASPKSYPIGTGSMLALSKRQRRKKSKQKQKKKKIGRAHV